MGKEMTRIQDLETKITEYKGRLKYLKQEEIKIDESLKSIQQEIIYSQKAQSILQLVAQKTQQELEYKISELCTLAQSAIFYDDPKGPYKVKIEFEIKRGKTECNIYFERDGHEYDPLSGSGGGAVDVLCFSLQIAIWLIAKPKTRNFMALDEPFSHLKGDIANRRAIQMVKKISDNIGLQILMVSDERVKKEDIIEGADKVFYIS
jgi:ABC-type cobalamin/Fe3+-siderophores transport system ATPase subunit